MTIENAQVGRAVMRLLEEVERDYPVGEIVSYAVHVTVRENGRCLSRTTTDAEDGVTIKEENGIVGISYNE